MSAGTVAAAGRRSCALADTPSPLDHACSIASPRDIRPGQERRRRSMLYVRAACLVVAALIFPVRVNADLPPAARPVLAPPMGLGSECGLLLSCPWSGPFAFHLRLGGQLWIPGE